MKRRILIALSGGVDSAVTAGLLVRSGYKVVAVMFELWSESNGDQQSFSPNRCCTIEQQEDAVKVASALDIPLHIIDIKDHFKRVVVDQFIESYSSAETPNPCIVCNELVRFPILVDLMRQHDAEFIATGHYARIRSIGHDHQLHRGVDEIKDQSYVLHRLTQSLLKRTLFPLGVYSKAQVREFAREMALPVSEKPESQDICFLRDGDYRRFLSQIAPRTMTPGPIYNTSGDLIGEHTGLASYTIGQRKGIHLHNGPWYVHKIDSGSNALIVGRSQELSTYGIIARDFSWIQDIHNANGKAPGADVHVQVRYRSQVLPCKIQSLGNKQYEMSFEKPQRDVSPGQYAVIYRNTECLGGGVIDTLIMKQGRK